MICSVSTLCSAQADRSMAKAVLTALTASLLLVLTGCAASQGPAVPTVAPDGGQERMALRSAVLQNHARGVAQLWSSSAAQARLLLEANQALVEAPDEQRLVLARQAWIKARQAYSPSEVLRFQGGPIDDEDGPEGQINGWPLDEAYIDYVVDQPMAGLVQDLKGLPVIDAASLLQRNEQGGEENIATGWHAVEFLLWGQDTNSDGPGTRPYTDYLPENPAALRRGAYLMAVSKLLVDDLAGLAGEWTEAAPGSFSEGFLADEERAVRGMWTGLAMLAGHELAGERIAVAYETRDQEDEQSCFSDTTHLDILANVQGIQQLYRGTIGGQQGPGLRELTAAFDPALAQQLDGQIEVALKTAGELTPPFDQAIQAEDGSPQRSQLSQLMSQLEAVAQGAAQAAQAMQLQINLAGH
ncbi:MAG: iron-regulated protein [Rickettsiales bacterium]|nr:iron-regulated protein [Rickettsiales bacterium]